MINLRRSLLYFLLLSPVLASAATFSASDLGLDSGTNKTFKYTGSGVLDMFWNGKTLLVKKVTHSNELLVANQQAKTWGNELKQDKLKFAESIVTDIDGVQSSLKKAQDEKNRVASELSSLRMAQKPLEDDETNSDVESLNAELRDINTEVSELRSRIHSLQYQRNKLGGLTVYNVVAVMSARPIGSFFIKTDKGLYLCEAESEAAKIINPITSQNVFGKKWSVRASSVLRLAASKPESISEIMLTLNIIDRGIVGVDLMSGQKYGLQRIYNDHVAKYEKLEKKHPVVVSKFSFKKDQLFLKYVQKNRSGSDILDINLKYTGKKKNLIQIFTKSSIKIVDPENKSGASTSHIGILAVTKKRLIQLKKQERVQGRIDSQWVHRYKKGLIKMGTTLLSVEGVDYYGWESLWYLASWMHINRLSDRKINLITGESVSGFTVTRINGSKYGGSKVTVSRSGASVYEFITDAKGFVKEYSFVPYKQKLLVQSIETTTTRNNKRLLSEFASKYSLIEIKG